MLERFEYATQAIACQLVRIADTRTQLRIGVAERDEKTIHCAHGRDGVLAPLKGWDDRLGRIALGQGMVAFARSSVCNVLVELFARLLQIFGRHP